MPVDNPSAYLQTKRIAENSASKIIGIAPDTGHACNRIEIHTQYLGAKSRFLKTPKILSAAFTVEALL